MMVFFPPHMNDTYFIIRVIGLPGDTVTYKDKQLYVNGELLPRELLGDKSTSRLQVGLEELGASDYLMQVDVHRRGADFSERVKPGHYFMMGDNRDNSSDSRVWGQVPEGDIVGKAFAIWMHWDRFLSVPSFSRVGAIQ